MEGPKKHHTLTPEAAVHFLFPTDSQQWFLFYYNHHPSRTLTTWLVF